MNKLLFSQQSKYLIAAATLSGGLVGSAIAHGSSHPGDDQPHSHSSSGELINETSKPYPTRPPVCVNGGGCETICSTTGEEGTGSDGDNGDTQTTDGVTVTSSTGDLSHSASDYKPSGASGGCSPCGASSSSVNSGMPVRVLRTFRSTRSSISGSFGKGISLEYDKTVEFATVGGKITAKVSDPNLSSTITLESAANGVFSDSNKWLDSATLLNTAGQPVADLAQARHFVVKAHDSTKTTFEIINLGSATAPQWSARLLSIKDRNNYGVELQYVAATAAEIEADPSVQLKLKSAKDATNRQLDFAYHSVKKGGSWVLSTINLPNGNALSYSYDAEGQLTSVAHPDSTASTFIRDTEPASGNPRLKIFESGASGSARVKTAVFAKLVGDGYPVLKVHNGDNELVYAVLKNDNLNAGKKIIYQGGRLRHQEGVRSSQYFAGNWKLEEQADGSVKNVGGIRKGEKVFMYAKGVSGKLSSEQAAQGKYPFVTYRNGTTVAQEHDADGFVSKKTYSDDKFTSTQRNEFSQITRSVDREGRVTKMSYDTRGNLIKQEVGILLVNGAEVQQPEYATKSNTYYPEGHANQFLLKSSTDYNGNTTDYVYNADNLVTSVIQPADVLGDPRPTSTYTYNNAKLLVSSTDPLGRTTTNHYDSRDRVVKVTYSDSSTEETSYGTGLSANLVVAQKDRNGNWSAFKYDTAGRRTDTVAGLSQAEKDGYLAGSFTPDQSKHYVESCTYLAATSLKSECYRNGNLTKYSYDYRNRLVESQTFPTAGQVLKSSSVYVDNLLFSTADPYGRRTFYVYRDSDKRQIKTIREAIPGAVDASTFTQLAALPRLAGTNAKYVITESELDSSGLRLASIDARGTRHEQSYDSRRRTVVTLSAVGSAISQRSETRYDGNSNVIERLNPRHFSEGINDRDTFTYTGRNLRKTHTTAAGSTLAATQSWTYFIDGRSKAHVDFRGNTANTLWHNCCGRLQGNVQRDGSSASISNTDYYGNVTHTAVVKNYAGGIDFHNLVDANTLAETTTRYDSRNRPTHSTRWLTALGNVVDHGVVPIAGLDGVPTTNGLTTSYAYDDNLTDGQGIEQTFAAQFTQLTARLGYNPFGANSAGSAVSVTNPAGETTVQVRDAAGRTLMSINPEGNISTMKYDALVNGADLQSPSADITISGNLLATTVVDANGNANTSYTDGLGRTVVSKDAAANLTVVAYDANSNVVKTRDANGLGTDCTFDVLNRDISCADRQEQSENVARTKIYNAASQVVSSTNAEGHTTTNVFDVRNRLASNTDANNITVAYVYDKNNNLKSLTDGNVNMREWVYDARNLKTQKVNPGAGDTLGYQYDALGRLVTKTDQLNDTCSMVYDLAGRMTSKVYKTGGTVVESTDSFTYDAASRLTSSTKGRYNVTTAHSYAADSMPLTESMTVDGVTFSSSRVYDAANRPVSHSFADAKSQAWAYDARNLVIGLTYAGQPVLTQSHDAGYRLKTQAFNNGYSRQLNYSRLDNLRSSDKTSNSSGVIGSLNWQYSYNVDKQVTAENTVGSFLVASSFSATYDAGDRLTAWNRGAGNVAGARQTEAWSYDGAGNQTTVTRDGTAQARQYNTDNELTSVAGTATVVDAKGNTTSDGSGQQYKYDLDNRIHEITLVNGDKIELSYDALGRRVSRKKGSSQKAFVWWGDQETSENELNATKTAVQNDLWAHPIALNKIVARAVAGDENNIQYYHKNYLDHVYAVSDKDGDIKEHYRYTAFGEAEIYNTLGQKLAESAIDNDVLWNSRRFDGDTELYYYKYRHYASKLGRWLSRDPIGEQGGINLYVFVQNDGINKWDRLGLRGVVVSNCSKTGKYKIEKRDRGFASRVFHGSLGQTNSGKIHVCKCYEYCETIVAASCASTTSKDYVWKEANSKFILSPHGYLAMRTAAGAGIVRSQGGGSVLQNVGAEVLSSGYGLNDAKKDHDEAVAAFKKKCVKKCKK